MNSSRSDSARLADESVGVFYDPIWDLVREFSCDARTYKREFLTGQVMVGGNQVTCPAVMQAARETVEDLADFRTGLPEGNQAELAMLLSFLSPEIARSYSLSIHTPGATGGLFATLTWLHQSCGLDKVYISDPSWSNHEHIVRSVGAEPVTYPYCGRFDASVCTAEMFEVLSKAKKEDCVILQPCCHNPTGLTLTPAEWSELARLLAANRVRVLFDASYVGLAESFAVDLSPVKEFVNGGCPLILIVSCSKLFGLYSERVGGVYILHNDDRMRETLAMLVGVVRAAWSSPSGLGLSLVNRVLTQPALCAGWQASMAQARTRMNGMRKLMSDQLCSLGLFAENVVRGRGVFCVLPLEEEETIHLRESFAIYLPNSGRMSFGRAWHPSAIAELGHALECIRSRRAS